MRVLFLICFFQSLSFSVCAETEAEIELRLQAEDAAFDEYNVYVSEMESTFAKRMKTELGLQCTGAGGIKHGTIQSLYIDFSAHRRATIEEARVLMITVLEQYLQTIRSNEKIQPFLETKPFPMNQVRVGLKFVGNMGPYSDGSVYWVFNACKDVQTGTGNTFLYHTKDPFTDSLRKILQESYEEALQKHANSPIKIPAAHVVTEKEQEADQLLDQFTDNMIRKYQMEPWSVGGEMTNQIEDLGGYFVVVRRGTQQEARVLMLEMAQQLLETFNSSQKIKPYLAESPFPVERLKLRLNFRKPSYGTYRDGTMESVVLEGGKLTYFREMPQEEREHLLYVPEVQTYATETYEEALERAKTAQEAEPKKVGFFSNLLKVVAG